MCSSLGEFDTLRSAESRFSIRIRVLTGDTSGQDFSEVPKTNLRLWNFLNFLVCVCQQGITKMKPIS
jgi:hypothetical protein